MATTKTINMKKFLLIALIAAGIVACDSPKPATGISGSDSTTTSSAGSTGSDSTMKRDSIPHP
jgi:hypothetical protein